jgi:tRNA-(ms[2]io[6]A)-hydroxylase
VADLPTLLLDHAHCEKKAASTALRFLSRHPEWPELVSAMSRLAREELIHFDRVLGHLKGRGVPFRQLHSASYAAELFAGARALGSDDQESAFVDELLVCALIEARSHERFDRLTVAVRAVDPALADFYGELGEAEARHGSLYVDLAEAATNGSVEARLSALSEVEARVIARANQPLRIHAGG